MHARWTQPMEARRSNHAAFASISSMKTRVFFAMAAHLGKNANGTVVSAVSTWVRSPVQYQFRRVVCNLELLAQEPHFVCDGCLQSLAQSCAQAAVYTQTLDADLRGRHMDAHGTCVWSSIGDSFPFEEKTGRPYSMSCAILQLRSVFTPGSSRSFDTCQL